jgi:hypothetical protein
MHVMDRHPQLLHLFGEVVDAVGRDRRRARWQYWHAGVGPTRWLCVVVDWRDCPPWMVTAFPSRRIKL